jgi:hypothetical protein
MSFRLGPPYKGTSFVLKIFGTRYDILIDEPERGAGNPTVNRAMRIRPESGRDIPRWLMRWDIRIRAPGSSDVA